MLARLVHKADFQRLLSRPIASRSAHFAVHHLIDCPTRPARPPNSAPDRKLSTSDEPIGSETVNNSVDRHWLATVLPKRHARRSVTRNLLRRQIRAVLQEQVDRLPKGLWLVRLRAPFGVEFRSAASARLRDTVRDELRGLFATMGRVR